MRAVDTTYSAGTLRASLAYEPQPLKFGTSGRRGEVVHLTQLEIYVNALAELEYLQSLPQSEGGIRQGDDFYFAYDLRPSSSKFDPQLGGRGEIAQAIVSAIRDSGLKPVNLGRIPTPALAHYALKNGRGSIMVTGSHIPFDRNGYKVNTSRGELLKKDEAPVNAKVEEVRARVYVESANDSLFDRNGLFRSGSSKLPRESKAGRNAYVQRYLDFFEGLSLKGKRILFYQHSAVGRDLVPEILRELGAEVVAMGKSDVFVPIDTENIDAGQLAFLLRMAQEAALSYGPIDAVLSTDGDSDRPLILSVDNTPDSLNVRFHGGDLVGMIVAEYLGADAVVVPVSCNDALDTGPLRGALEPKTRIGSPFVIAGMEKARASGRSRICGWEANGGFLTGSDIERRGKVLSALPTRDAVLPILCVLFASAEKKVSIGALFDQLPRRFSRAALLKNLPRAASLKILQRFAPADARVNQIEFPAVPGGVRADIFNEDRRPACISDEDIKKALNIREGLSKFFRPSDGFGSITWINYTDGIRIHFSNGDVGHVRPSGNADELRIYAVADTQERADAIARLGVAEPDGILRSLARSVAF